MVHVTRMEIEVIYRTAGNPIRSLHTTLTRGWVSKDFHIQFPLVRGCKSGILYYSVHEMFTLDFKSKPICNL